MNEHLGVFLNNTTSFLKNKVNLNNFINLSNDFSGIIIIDVNNDLSQNLKNEIETNLYKNNILVEYFLDDALYETRDFNINKINMILKKPDLLNYKYITFIHDKYIYTDSISEYLKYVSEHNLDFCTFTDSLNDNYNYQYETFIFSIKNENIKIISNIINKNKYIIGNEEIKADELNNNDFDINIIHKQKLFENSLPYLKLAYLYKNSERFDGNIFLNDIYKELYIIGKIPIISIEHLNFFKNNYKYKYFIFSEIPENFDIDVYKKNVPELINSDNNVLKQNFLNQGQFLYKNYSTCKNYINYVLPDYLRTSLSKCKLLYFFDVPDNFNVYKYKEHNFDLHGFNETQLIIHWLNYGHSENRLYY